MAAQYQLKNGSFIYHFVNLILLGGIGLFWLISYLTGESTPENNQIFTIIGSRVLKSIIVVVLSLLHILISFSILNTSYVLVIIPCLIMTDRLNSVFTVSQSLSHVVLK